MNFSWLIILKNLRLDHSERKSCIFYFAFGFKFVVPIFFFFFFDIFYYQLKLSLFFYLKEDFNLILVVGFCQTMSLRPNHDINCKRKYTGIAIVFTF